MFRVLTARLDYKIVVEAFIVYFILDNWWWLEYSRNIFYLWNK